MKRVRACCKAGVQNARKRSWCEVILERWAVAKPHQDPGDHMKNMLPYEWENASHVGEVPFLTRLFWLQGGNSTQTGNRRY